MLIGLMLLVLGMALVLWGAERFTEGAVGTALRFQLSTFYVGVVVSGFEPENLVTGIVAALGHLHQIALGTVIGSGVFVKGRIVADNVPEFGLVMGVWVLGGLLALKQVAALAEANDAVIAPHQACGPVATAVCLNIAACTNNHFIQEFFDPFHRWSIPYNFGLEAAARAGLVAVVADDADAARRAVAVNLLYQCSWGTLVMGMVDSTARLPEVRRPARES